MFVYFVPTSSQTVTDSVVSEVSHVISGVDDCHGAYTSSGVSGPGMYVARRNVSTQHFHSAEKSEWRKIPDSKAWVRLAEEATHDGLARPELLDGKFIPLADGKRWLIPHAFVWMADEGTPRYGSRLPAYDQLGEDGKWTTGEVLPRYKRLWDVTQGIVSLMSNTEEDSVDYQAEVESVVVALSASYYVGPAECDLMKVLSREIRWPVWNVLMDWQSYLDITKKNGPDS